MKSENKAAVKALNDMAIAKENARKTLEEEQIVHHKKLMADRRAEFVKKFQTIWSTGPTGCSIFYTTTETQQAGEKLIADLLSETLVAEVEQKNPDTPQHLGLKRHFITHEIMFPTEVEFRNKNHRLMGVTSDLRVGELIERIATHKVGSEKIPFDTIIVPLINASPDYIEWVKEQTMKKDPEPAFFNLQPEAAMEALDNKVSDISFDNLLMNE